MRAVRRISLWLFAVFAFVDLPIQAANYSLARANLRDQFGNDLDFSRDAIGDRVVIIGFTWGGCKTVCPITDQVMALTQQQLAQRRKSHRMITLTLDRLGDPPAAMAAKARQIGAGREWLWLSGSYGALTAVLAGLNTLESDLAAHPPRFLIVDGQRKIVRLVSGVPRPEELIAAADKLLASRSQ